MVSVSLSLFDASVFETRGLGQRNSTLFKDNEKNETSTYEIRASVHCPRTHVPFSQPPFRQLCRSQLSQNHFSNRELRRSNITAMCVHVLTYSRYNLNRPHQHYQLCDRSTLFMAYLHQDRRQERQTKSFLRQCTRTIVDKDVWDHCPEQRIKRRHHRSLEWKDGRYDFREEGSGGNGSSGTGGGWRGSSSSGCDSTDSGSEGPGTGSVFVRTEESSDGEDRSRAKGHRRREEETHESRTEDEDKNSSNSGDRGPGSVGTTKRSDRSRKGNRGPEEQPYDGTAQHERTKRHLVTHFLDRTRVTCETISDHTSDRTSESRKPRKDQSRNKSSSSDGYQMHGALGEAKLGSDSSDTRSSRSSSKSSSNVRDQRDPRNQPDQGGERDRVDQEDRPKNPQNRSLTSIRAGFRHVPSSGSSETLQKEQGAPPSSVKAVHGDNSSCCSRYTSSRFRVEVEFRTRGRIGYATRSTVRLVPVT